MNSNKTIVRCQQVGEFYEDYTQYNYDISYISENFWK